MGDVFSTIGILGLVAGISVLIFLMLVVARLYQRSSKELAFVRTGFGGQRVIMDGGSLVLPVLHEVIPVNMNTLRLEVRRAESGALITKDRMRVDVSAEFYVRVKPTEEAIADAAQTLGRRTMDTGALKELVEGKFVDALRAVAAEMEMAELHEQRVEFVQKVQTAVSEDLLKNGLELESVSLTSLDQTDREFFNPTNAFDAQGLTKLTEEIEARRKQRNDIEQDTEVAIQQKNLNAEQLTLAIKRDEEYARLEQQREVEVRRALQSADIAQEQADQQRAAEEARIRADQQVEQARISKERQVRESDIERERVIETRDVDKRKTVELSDQDRMIAIAHKTREESEAKAEADRARADAVSAEEAVVTVREEARAERQKTIELVEARKRAEQEAIQVTVAAAADKQAADDQADAIRTMAEGHAGEKRIAAQAEAEAEKMVAEAARVRYEVDAEGARNLNQAENLLSPEVIAMKIRLALLEKLDDVIRESVKPMEAIEGIKIVHVDGLTGSNGSSAGEPGGAAAGNLADQAVGAALRYRAQAPLLDSLMREVGLDGGDLNGLTEPLGDAAKGGGSDGGSSGPA